MNAPEKSEKSVTDAITNNTEAITDHPHHPADPPTAIPDHGIIRLSNKFCAGFHDLCDIYRPAILRTSFVYINSKSTE